MNFIPEKRERNNLSKLPEDQFPPSFSPPTFLSFHHLLINFFVRFTNPPTTDWPTVLFSLNWLVYFPALSTDRPTNRRSHLSPVSPSLRPLTAPSQISDVPTDRPTVGQSVWWNQLSEEPHIWISLTPRPPTDRRTDGPTIGQLVWWNYRSETYREQEWDFGCVGVKKWV